LTYESDVELQSSMTTQKQTDKQKQDREKPKAKRKAVQFHLLKFEVRKKRNTKLTHCYN